MAPSPLGRLAVVSEAATVGLFEFAYMRHALVAGTIVAVLAAAVGWFLVARRQAFAAHTLSAMAFPGGAVAALAGLSAGTGYYCACLLAALLIVLASRRGGRAGSGEAAAVGTIQAAALALGFLALSLYGGILEDLESLLFGSVLAISYGQVLTLALVAGGALLTLAALARPLWFASVDETLAHASGVPTGALAAVFLVLVAVAVAATVQITGALLVFALLVAPAAAAQRITARAGAGILLGILLALAIVWSGLAIAYYSDQPPGFLIPALALGVYLLAHAGALAVGGERAAGDGPPGRSWRVLRRGRRRAGRRAARGESQPAPGARKGAVSVR